MKRIEIVILLAFLVAGQFLSGCAASRKMALEGKADDLMNLQVTEKLDDAAKIKGKIAVVETYPNTPASLEGFKPDGTVDRLSQYFFSPEKKAQTLDEIETLVKVACRQGRSIGNSTRTVYANECDVSVIDFKTKVLFNKKKFENSIIPTGTSSTASTVVPAPSEEIKSHLLGLSLLNLLNKNGT